MDTDLLAKREQSLRRAWTILQVIRSLVEASRGEPLPRPAVKSLDEEGRILCEALGAELFDLHDKLNAASSAAGNAWEFHMGRSQSTTISRDIKRAKEFPRLAGPGLWKLRELAKQGKLRPTASEEAE